MPFSWGGLLPRAWKERKIRPSGWVQGGEKNKAPKSAQAKAGKREGKKKSWGEGPKKGGVLFKKVQFLREEWKKGATE